MNALLAFGRLAFAHREKVVLIVMILLCGLLGLLNQRARNTDNGDSDTDENIEGLVWDRSPRKEQEYTSIQLENSRDWETVSEMFQRRWSVFHLGTGGGGGGGRDLSQGPTPWPEIRVRQVSQPTPGGVWIAQLEIAGKIYIARENRSVDQDRYEVQRIDKTRLCVELLRRFDDEVREFCQN